MGTILLNRFDGTGFNRWIRARQVTQEATCTVTREKGAAGENAPLHCYKV
jgi:hypothetical protein